MKRIKIGWQKFNSENIKIRTFFAPNHTYDKNTFQALKNLGLNEIIDGYGLIPYSEFDIKFIPQLFYQNIMLPFGIQSTQIHLNYWDENDFKLFKKFIIKNKKKIITYDQAVVKGSNSFINLSINFFLKMGLKTLRAL